MKRIRPWQVVAIISAAYILVALAGNDFAPKKLALIGAVFDPTNANRPLLGYDGQFAYQIAHDPVNGWTKIDVPAYRYQRILYPIVARWLALGQPGLIDWSLIAVNVAALIAGTFFTEKILTHYHANRWYALVYGLSAGTFMSARLDLTEPLAYGLVQAAVWCVLTKRSRTAALLLALAALTKETTLIFAAGVGAAYLLRRDWRKLTELGLLVTGPFIAWQLALLIGFGRFGIGSGGANASSFQIVPLRGLWLAATSVDTAFFVYLMAVMLPMAVIPTLIGLRVAIRDLLDRRVDLPVIMLLLNCAVMLIVPHSTYNEPMAMARFSVGLMVSVLLYAAARGSKRGLNYALLWTFTLVLYDPVKVTVSLVPTLGGSLMVCSLMLIEWILNKRRSMYAVNPTG